MKPIVLLAGLVALCCGLVACGGAGGLGAPPTQISCAFPTGTVLTPVFPINGATGVPTSITQIVVADNPPLPNSWQIVLSAPNGSAAAQGNLTTIAASAVPSPAATPAFSASPTYQASNITSTLAPGTTYQVSLWDSASNCNVFNQIATFTTQ
jgi:hypothetical protein